MLEEPWGHAVRGPVPGRGTPGEIAWNPHLTPDQFYHDYARRIFGERAEGPMFQAFMALEDMEGHDAGLYPDDRDFHSVGPSLRRI